MPEPESSDLSARRCWATAQPTDSGTRRLGRGPTTPPWVKVARSLGTFRLWYHRPSSVLVHSDQSTIDDPFDHRGLARRGIIDPRCQGLRPGLDRIESG